MHSKTAILRILKPRLSINSTQNNLFYNFKFESSMFYLFSSYKNNIYTISPSDHSFHLSLPISASPQPLLQPIITLQRPLQPQAHRNIAVMAQAQSQEIIPSASPPHPSQPTPSPRLLRQRPSPILIAISHSTQWPLAPAKPRPGACTPKWQSGTLLPPPLRPHPH